MLALWVANSHNMMSANIGKTTKFEQKFFIQIHESEAKGRHVGKDSDRTTTKKVFWQSNYQSFHVA